MHSGHFQIVIIYQKCAVHIATDRVMWGEMASGRIKCFLIKQYEIYG